MDKLAAEIIKEAMIGETNGHMAAVPNSPIIFSMFRVYSVEQSQTKGKDELFVNMLEDMIKALKS